MEPHDGGSGRETHPRSYDEPPVAVGITPVPDEPPPSWEAPTTTLAEPMVAATGTHVYPSLDEPSRFVHKYLFDSERYCGEWRRHWIHIAKWVGAGALGTLLLGYVIGAAGDSSTVVTVSLVLWAVLMLFVGWRLVDWYYDRFVLTNKRVLLVEGILNRRVGMMPLARVTDMAYKQTLLGRMLDYGTFVLESAGQDQALSTITPLPSPNDLYLLFCQEMYDPDGSQRRLLQQGSGNDREASGD